MNRTIRTVSKELAAWELHDRIIREQAPDEDRSDVQRFIEDGRALREDLIEIVHEEVDPTTFELDMMRSWVRFSIKARREFGV